MILLPAVPQRVQGSVDALRPRRNELLQFIVETLQVCRFGGEREEAPKLSWCAGHFGSQRLDQSVAARTLLGDPDIDGLAINVVEGIEVDGDIVRFEGLDEV